MKNLNFVSILFLSLLMVSCSTVEPKKFDNFESTINKLNTSLEGALLNVQKNSREHGIQKFSISPLSKASDLTITLNGYDWSMAKPPLYLTLIKTNQQLIKMNNTFEEYVELLSQLSSASLSKEELTDSARELNKNSSKLASTVGVGGSKKTFNILSTAAIGLMQNYIDSKKAKFLDDAIKNNQNSVEEFTKLQVGLIQVILKNIKQTYDEKFLELGKQWIKTTNKAQISAQMFELNDSLIAALSFYEELEDAYKALPKAHQHLATKKPGNNLNKKIDSLMKSTNKILDIQKNVSKKEG